MKEEVGDPEVVNQQKAKDKEGRLSMAHVVTKNLENFLLREREIDNMEAEIRKEQALENEDGPVNSSMLDQSIMAVGAMDEMTYKNLSLVVNTKELEDRKQKMQLFFFILLIFMV